MSRASYPKSADPASLGFSALEPADFLRCKTPPLPLPRAPAQRRPRPSPAGPGVLTPPLAHSFLLPGAPGALLGCIRLRFRALVCFLGAPAASDRLRGVTLGAILAPKMIIFDGFLRLLLRSLYLLVGVVFGAVFRFVFCLFWPRAKNTEDRNSTHPPCENLVFQGARPRRRSPEDDHKPL